MRNIALQLRALLGPPKLSEEELDRERRKREITSALRQARSRLDTVHGLVRAKKPEDAASTNDCMQLIDK